MVPTTHGDAERSCEGARIGAAAVALVRAVPGEAHAHTHSASDHRLRAKRGAAREGRLPLHTGTPLSMAFILSELLWSAAHSLCPCIDFSELWHLPGNGGRVGSGGGRPKSGGPAFFSAADADGEQVDGVDDVDGDVTWPLLAGGHDGIREAATDAGNGDDRIGDADGALALPDRHHHHGVLDDKAGRTVPDAAAMEAMLANAMRRGSRARRMFRKSIQSPGGIEMGIETTSTAEIRDR